MYPLVLKVNPIPGDRIIFVGDLVDKGLESLSTLRYVRMLVSQLPGSVVVSGNHEEKASRQAKRGIFGERWTEEATESDWAFIAAMPLTWYDPALNVRVVHGGIFPALLEKHPDVFEKIEARGDKWRKGGGKVMNRARRMLRVRHVGGTHRPPEAKQGPGAFLDLESIGEDDPFWADVYDGRNGFVIYGHSPWLDGKVRRSDYTLGIDTACVFGGRLTAAVVDNEGGPITTVSVDAARRYAEPLKDD
jgi:hypothetical protein